MFQNTRAIALKFGPRVAAAAALPALLVGNAQAAVDADITAAITGAGTDLLVVAGAITVVMATLWAAMLIKRKFFG